ncbi:O-antigen ligase family protein [Luteococcus sp. OSA5]|uniref:O-antigen ligase family protein n=1 Tax=Luteococcus sp. OSA5 TaxID=3401630 RepID=UPI003B42BC1D
MSSAPATPLAHLLALGLGVALVQAPWSGCAELGCLLILGVLFWRRPRFEVGSPLLLLLLAAWLGLSMLWSVDAFGTVKAAVRSCLLLATGVMLVRSHRWRDVVASLAIGTGGLCALAMVWVALYPSEAIDHNGLKGMTPHNNTMGYIAAVALVSSLLAWGLPRLLRWPLVALTAITLLLSDSMTSWLAAASGLLVAAVLPWLRRRSQAMQRALGVLTVGSLVCLAYLSTAVPVTALLGRDATLTGRTNIWPAVLEVAHRRWLFGWGHGAPWLEGSWIREWAHYRFNFPMQTAHNAMLENYLQLGLVGTVLVSLLCLFAALRLLHAFRATGQAVALLALLTLHLVHGMAEATQSAFLAWLVLGIVWSARPRLAGPPTPMRAASAPLGQALTEGVPGRPGAQLFVQ